MNTTSAPQVGQLAEACTPAVSSVGRLRPSRCACGSAKPQLAETCDGCRGRLLQPQRLTEGGGGPETPPGSAGSGVLSSVLAAPGQPLDGPSRRYFEPRFRQDFSRVRVHTGAAAEASTRAIRARAYTADHHVVFGRGEYRPGSSRTRRLLAHELTHVVQQRAGRKSDAIEHPGSAAELEAESNERRLMAGAAPVVREQASGISRTCSASNAGDHMTGEESNAEDCERGQQRVLGRAFNRAGDRVCDAIDKLWDLWQEPEADENSGTRDAFQRHFHTTDNDAVLEVYNVLSDLGMDMGRGRYSVDCGDDTDPDCEGFGAYVPSTGASQIVFCPDFFDDMSNDDRTGLVVHEVAHTTGRLQVRDRAYQSDRQLPFLTTAEALHNAESYELLVEELATGRRVNGTAPRDEFEDCTEDLEPMARRALALAERWNNRAFSHSETTTFGQADFEAHLGDSSRATRRQAKDVFRKAESRFSSAFEIQCEQEGDDECAENPAYGRPGSDNRDLGTGLGFGIGGALGVGLGVGLGVALAASVGVAAAVSFGIAIGAGLFGIGGALGFLIGHLTSSRNTIHVCASWRGESERDRARSLLAAVYSMEDGMDVGTGRDYATLARSLHDRDIADVN